MNILIIIPTVPGNEELVDKCLHAIEDTAGYPFGFIIGLNDWVSFANGVNRGLKHMIGGNYDAAVIINDDMTMKPEAKGWLARLVTQYEKLPGIVGCEDTVRDFENRRKHFTGGFILIPRWVVEKIGYLDERFKYGEWEDLDYSARCMDAGVPISFIEGIPYHHHGSHTLTQLKGDKRLDMKKNRDRFLEKWKGTKWELLWA